MPKALERTKKLQSSGGFTGLFIKRPLYADLHHRLTSRIVLDAGLGTEFVGPFKTPITQSEESANATVGGNSMSKRMTDRNNRRGMDGLRYGEALEPCAGKLPRG